MDLRLATFNTLFVIAEQKPTASATVGRECLCWPSFWTAALLEIHLQLLPLLQVCREPRSDRLPDGLLSIFSYSFFPLIEGEATMWVERKRRKRHKKPQQISLIVQFKGISLTFWEIYFLGGGFYIGFHISAFKGRLVRNIFSPVVPVTECFNVSKRAADILTCKTHVYSLLYAI